jgi:two-component system, LytTR family, sensor kinase
MVHPILRDRKITYYYLSLWLFAGTLPWPIMYYFYEGGPNWVWPILIDALVSNILFCGMSINFWYVVRYINIETSTPSTIIINHLVLGIISTSICLFISSLIVKSALVYWEGYYDFMLQSMPARFMMGLTIYSVVILLYYTIIFYYNLQEKSKQEAQLQTLMKEAELTVLKSQINPHFIFNSLNSISSLTIIRPNQAREMVIKLSEFLRYALDQDMKQKTKLANELENIKRYLEIEKIRFGERLKFELTIDKESEGNSLPNMILQPLLENAIKHGVHESTEPINIEVHSKSDGRFLNITIRNNYDSEVKAKKSSGIGIKNIQQRLQLIYGRSDLFRCENTGNVFEVNLSFPQQ